MNLIITFRIKCSNAVVTSDFLMKSQINEKEGCDKTTHK